MGKPAIALAYTSGVIAPYVMDGIKEALTMLGFRIVLYTPDLLDRLYKATDGPSTDRIPYLGAALKRWAARNGVIAVIGYGGNLLCKIDDQPDFIQPCVVAGIPSVSLWYDRPFDILYKYGREAPLTWNTAFWQQTCFDKKYIADLQTDGFQNVHYLPLGTNERIFQPLSGRALSDAAEKYSTEAVFVGSYTELRAETMKRLSDSCGEARIAIFGDDGWRADERTSRCFRGGVKYGTELNAVYCASKVVINLDTPQLIISLNNRVFDALAGGNLIVTENKPDALDHFEPRKDLLVYTTIEELADLVNAVCDSPDAYSTLPARGREKVLAYHTWTKRVRTLLRLVAPAFEWKIVDAE